MSKLRSDSKWSELTEEQRDTLEGWLFEENVSYREGVERLQKEFGITASLAGLARFYRQLAHERMEAEFLDLKSKTEQAEKTPYDLQRLGAAAMSLVANRLVHLAVERPEKVRELTSMARVLLANQAVEVKKRWVEMAEVQQEHEIRTEHENTMARQAKTLRMLNWMKETESKATPATTASTDAKVGPAPPQEKGGPQ